MWQHRDCEEMQLVWHLGGLTAKVPACGKQTPGLNHIKTYIKS